MGTLPGSPGQGAEQWPRCRIAAPQRGVCAGAAAPLPDTTCWARLGLGKVTESIFLMEFLRATPNSPQSLTFLGSAEAG